MGAGPKLPPRFLPVDCRLVHGAPARLGDPSEKVRPPDFLSRRLLGRSTGRVEPLRAGHDLAIRQPDLLGKPLWCSGGRMHGRDFSRNGPTDSCFTGPGRVESRRPASRLGPISAYPARRHSRGRFRFGAPQSPESLGAAAVSCFEAAVSRDEDAVVDNRSSLGDLPRGVGAARARCRSLCEGCDGYSD